MRLWLFLPVRMMLVVIRLLLSVLVEFPARIVICCLAVFDLLVDRFEVWSGVVDEGELSDLNTPSHEHFVRAWKNINL